MILRIHFWVFFGITRLESADWRYSEHMNSPDLTVRCQFDIRLNASRGLDLEVTPGATCQDQGGYGTELRGMSFPQSTYIGPVTSELDDPSAFFERQSGCGSQ